MASHTIIVRDNETGRCTIRSLVAKPNTNIEGLVLGMAEAIDRGDAPVPVQQTATLEIPLEILEKIAHGVSVNSRLRSPQQLMTFAGLERLAPEAVQADVVISTTEADSGAWLAALREIHLQARHATWVPKVGEQARIGTALEPVKVLAVARQQAIVASEGSAERPVPLSTLRPIDQVASWS